MAFINFLFKVKTLTDRSGEAKTQVKVFDCIQDRTVIKTFFYRAGSEEILHWINTSKEFDYKHYSINFISTDTVKF